MDLFTQILDLDSCPPKGKMVCQPVHTFAGIKKKSLGLGLRLHDEGGVPREMLGTRLHRALVSSGSEPGWPSVYTSYLAILVVQENPSVQTALASPKAGKIPATPMPPSCEMQ